MSFFNQVIPFGEFESGMNFIYNFVKNGDNFNTSKGHISASSTNSSNTYDLYISNEDIHSQKNGSLINDIKDNIKYIYISSTNQNGILLNSSYSNNSNNVYMFNSSIVSGNIEEISGPSIIDFTLTRNIAGSGGSSGSGVLNVVAGDGLTGGGNSSTVTLNVVGGTGITVNSDNISINSSVTTLDNTQTLTNKTLTNPVLNGSISGSAVLDEDDMTSNSATALATQQSIKAYVDSKVSGCGSSAFTLNLGNDITLDNASYTDYIPIHMNGTYSAGSMFSASNSTEGSASFTSILTNTTVDLCIMYGLAYDTEGDSNTHVFCKLQKHTGSGSWTDIDDSTLVGWSHSSTASSDTFKSVSRTLLQTLQSNECVRMVIKFTASTSSRNKILFNNASGSTYLSVFNIKSQNDSSASGITNIVGGAGLTVNNSIDTPTLSVNVDDSTIEIDTDTLRIKDGGVSLSKMSNLSGMKVIGNASNASATPKEISILDEDDLTSDSATSLATQQSIKAYVDDQISTAGISMNGSTAGGLLTYSSSSIADVESSLRFNGSGLTIDGGLIVNGDIRFNGSKTEIHSDNVIKTDPLLELNSSLSGENTKDTGLILHRGSASNVFIGWDESKDKIAFGLGNFSGSATGNLTFQSLADVYGGNASFTNIHGNISNATGYNASALNGSITNSQLTSSSFTLGNIDISLGDTVSSITGLTNISGSGNASFTSGSFTTLETYDLIVTNEIDGTLTQTVNTDNNSFQTGAALYISGSLTNDSRFRVSLANANNSSTMPVIGLKSGNNKAVTYGLLRNISDTVFDSTGISYEAGQTIYASASNSGSLTNVKPSDNSDLIQNIGILKKYDSNNSAIFITGIGRSNDIPNASLVNYSDIEYIYGKNDNNRFIRASTANISGISASFTNGSFTNISGDISNTTGYPTSSLTGTITNGQLEGSIANDKLVNDTVSFGGVSVSLGNSDATPAFNLSDATGYPASRFMLNGSNNRILTSTGTDGMNAEENLTFDGNRLDVTGDIYLPDNKKIYLGNSNDLSIYHNGSNSHIDELGTGDLVISATHLRLRSGSQTETFLLGTENDSVELYFNGSKTFETSASGITITDINGVTGTVTGNLSGNVTGNLTGNVNGNVTGNITGQVSDISNHDTDALSEGSTNLYFTDARSRGAISVNDSGGDGSLEYDSSTGIIKYIGPSASEVRAHISVSDAGGDGSLAYNSSTGVITYTGPSASDVRAHFSAGTGVTITDGTIAIGQAVGTGDDVTFNSVTGDASGTSASFTNISGNNLSPLSGNDITLSGNIIPSASNTYDLGSKDKPFSELYLSGSTLYLGDYKIVEDGDHISFLNASNEPVTIKVSNKLFHSDNHGHEGSSGADYNQTPNPSNIKEVVSGSLTHTIKQPIIEYNFIFGNVSSYYNRLSAFVYHNASKIHAVGTLDSSNNPPSSSTHSAWGQGAGSSTNKYPVSFKFPYVDNSGNFVTINQGDLIYLKICNPHVSTFKIYKPSIFVHSMSNNIGTHSFEAFGGK